MLSLAKLSKVFWDEALNTACYLINLSPSSPLKGDVPKRVWIEKNISYSHLRVFGCKAFIHICKEHRSKLDDKAIQCIFLGYGVNEFGYKLWDPKAKKMYRSRDVIFHENQTYSNFDKEEQPKRLADEFLETQSTLPIHENNG